jgi:hypothetical protein
MEATTSPEASFCNVTVNGEPLHHRSTKICPAEGAPKWNWAGILGKEFRKDSGWFWPGGDFVKAEDGSTTGCAAKRLIPGPSTAMPRIQRKVLPITPPVARDSPALLFPCSQGFLNSLVNVDCFVSSLCSFPFILDWVLGVDLADEPDESPPGRDCAPAPKAGWEWCSNLVAEEFDSVWREIDLPPAGGFVFPAGPAMGGRDLLSVPFDVAGDASFSSDFISAEALNEAIAIRNAMASVKNLFICHLLRSEADQGNRKQYQGV